MCARYTLSVPPQLVATLFGVVEVPALRPRYNIAPGQPAPVVRLQGGARTLVMLRWGLVPSWAEDPKIGYKLINARSEEADAKPSFRAAFRRRRCLIPADGFYEWKDLGGRKQPYYLRLRSREPFALAGLWERWQGQSGEEIESFTVLTTEPNPLVAEIHNRMPVILQPEHYTTWLNEEEQDARALKPLLGPLDASLMEAYPVDPRVNRPQNDDPHCIEPMDAQ